VSGAQYFLRQALVKTAVGLDPRKGTQFLGRVNNCQCRNKKYASWNDAGYCFNKGFQTSFD